MPMTPSELDDFHAFAMELLNNSDVSSLAECVHRWESHRDYEASVDAIREGLADSAAGRTQPVAEAFADIRRELGLPERRPVS